MKGSKRKKVDSQIFEKAANQGAYLPANWARVACCQFSVFDALFSRRLVSPALGEVSLVRFPNLRGGNDNE